MFKFFKYFLFLLFFVFVSFVSLSSAETISGNVVDVVSETIYPAKVVIKDGKIADIKKIKKGSSRPSQPGRLSWSKQQPNRPGWDSKSGPFLIPGLIDAHVHIESSMLPPSEFARLAVTHGTVATVSDPHEIANVLGIPGIDYMIEDGKKVTFKFYFGASSCVPATDFETAGARLSPEDVGKLLDRPEIKYLSEMMNYQGVINNDPQVLAKIEAAKARGKSVDGHAPGLMGKDLEKYVKSGIYTDHETYKLEEGLEKLSLGMKVIIREGSAAKNFDTLHTLIGKSPEMVMFCSDDKHPDDLAKGHINEIVKRAIKLGYDKIKVLRCATYNPVKHYGLEVGLLQKRDPADFIVVDNLDDFNVLKTYIDGHLVADGGKTLIPRVPHMIVNNFNASKKEPTDFHVRKGGEYMFAIGAIDGQLITSKIKALVKEFYGSVESDTERDILKIAVINRYNDAPPAVAFVRNFGLKKGAIASSFAHDSHNVVITGVSDNDISRAANIVIDNRGGLSIAHDEYEDSIRLPIAGLMSDEDGYEVAKKYSELTKIARELGSELRAPYMTLSFMVLLVMPEIKLSDKGLFDADAFKFMNLFYDN